MHCILFFSHHTFTAQSSTFFNLHCILYMILLQTDSDLILSARIALRVRLERDSRKDWFSRCQLRCVFLPPKTVHSKHTHTHSHKYLILCVHKIVVIANCRRADDTFVELMKAAVRRGGSCGWGGSTHCTVKFYNESEMRHTHTHTQRHAAVVVNSPSDPLSPSSLSLVDDCI